jgi:hypothetical protein
MQATTTFPVYSIAIVVTYVPATNCRGSRIKIEIPRMKAKRFFSLDHSFNSTTDQTFALLSSLNIECSAFAELEKSSVFFVSFRYWEALWDKFGKKH